MGIAQSKGRAGETLAAAYLVLQGWTVLAHNTRLADVEVDLLAREQRAHVVVEVKYRSRADYGGAALAVSHVQRSRLMRAARALARDHPGPIRIDVIAIELGEGGLSLRHYRNAIAE